MTYQLLVAANILAEKGINAEVVHVPTVKPLDNETIIASARRTGRVLTAEEGQVAGGFGGAVAELLGDQLPTPYPGWYAGSIWRKRGTAGTIRLF
jgi:transketolase